MTGWSWPGTRHIPEEELHAYLDQSLSRSQCVEIECHLAECRHCQKERDRGAAVRDRITALLADAEPRRVIMPPPFEQLVARRQERVLARRISVGRLARFFAAAAGLVAAVGAGWWSRGRLDPPAAMEPRPAEVTVEQPPSPVVQSEIPESRTLTAVGPVQTVGTPVPEPSIEVEPGSPERIRLTPAVAEVVNRPSVQVRSVTSDEDALPLDGLWQSVGWQEAATLAGGNLPRIEGLPVVDVQLQRGLEDERPLVVVAQQHPSGRIIRTFEGPLKRVAALIDEQLSREPNRLRASSPSLTPPDYIADGSETTRRGLRILAVTGNFSADSLNALARGIDLHE